MCRVIVLAIFLAAAGPAMAQNVVSLQARHNMFYADITLNERVTIRALIDTGATYLHFCEDTATALGLTLGAQVELLSFAGPIMTRRATIETLRIGTIEVRDVPALVKPNKTSCEHVLVGMAVLRKLNSVLLTRNTLVLVGPPPAKPAPIPAAGSLFKFVPGK